MKNKPETIRKFKDINEMTPREAEALALKKSGKKIREVAEILGVSFATANNLIAKAKDKERDKND